MKFSILSKKNLLSFKKITEKRTFFIINCDKFVPWYDLINSINNFAENFSFYRKQF